MRAWIQLGVLSAVGTLVGFGCSSDRGGDALATVPDRASEYAGDGGAAGAHDDLGPGGGGAGSVKAGAAGDDSVGISDGASGGTNCESDVDPSHAIISADLPIPFADAGDATFTACRNSECYSAKGDFHVYETWWVQSKAGDPLILTFDDATAVPSVTLEWSLFQPDVHPMHDHYQLSVQRGADPELVVFDTYADYDFVFVDPEYAADTTYCFKIYSATVDLRSGSAE